VRNPVANNSHVPQEPAAHSQAPELRSRENQRRGTLRELAAALDRLPCDPDFASDLQLVDQSMNSPSRDSWNHRFRTLSDVDQAHVLAAFAFELTILARDSYEVESDQLSDPALLRRLNEIQHRTTSAILARLRNDKARYPDDVLLQIIVDGNDHLDARVRGSFAKAWNAALGGHLDDDS